MRQFLVATSLAVIVSMGGMSAPLWAKPADLPADDKIKCPDGQVKGEHGGITIDLDALSGRVDEPTPLDAVSPVVIGVWLEQWLDAVARMLPNEPAQVAYEAAESARRAGDFAAARTGYQHVHFLTPTSRLGRMAIDRIIEIESRQRDASEEPESTAPRPEPLPMRRDTDEGYRPLGLVELTY